MPCRACHPIESQLDLVQLSKGLDGTALSHAIELRKRGTLRESIFD
jgi:hypothetical protein